MLSRSNELVGKIVQKIGIVIMDRRFIKIGDQYQHSDHKRPGTAVKLDGQSLILRDTNGDVFRVNLPYLEYAPIRKEGDYWMDLNVNYAKEKANVFLCWAVPFERRAFSQYRCLGGADKGLDGRWRVTVNEVYDSETDSDARLVGYFDTQALAIDALWNERHSAYKG